MDEEERAGSMSKSGPTFIKKRSKGRGAGSASSTAPRTSLLRSNEQVEGEEGGEEAAVQRSAGIGARGKSGRGGEVRSKRASNATALSFGEGENEPAFELKKSALSREARRIKSAGPPESLDQANIAATSSNGYSASALAALKASTPARRRVDEEDGQLDNAHQDMVDPTTQTDEHGNSLTRLKFGADFAHEGIPNEALVAAAKERRRRAAEGGGAGDDDFISLREGPHAESRLQREEDEVGSGEEEFAEFTGATERVALGQKAIREAKDREREAKREAMDLDHDSDDSGQEWEKAQMGRIDGGARRKQKEKREKSPFRPAPIPLTSPLPTLTSTSARLAARVKAVEDSIKSHGQVVDDAVRQLQQLEEDEKRNKEGIQEAGEREAWFRELDEFIISLSAFLDDKMIRLEEIEADWRALLVERALVVQRARAATMSDEVSLFYGVPAHRLQPKAGIEEEEEEDAGADGGALSVIRETRRTASPPQQDSLSPSDQAAFQVAQNDILRRLRQMLNDVKAPEFTDPAIRVDGRLHPSSLVARFHQWRTLYPVEYANAWGGLTLAGIWDFWARKEVCGWDVVKAGNRSLDDFGWHKELSQFSSTVGQDGATATLGGDDEVIPHILCNTVIPGILETCEKGAFDPWSVTDCKSMMELVEQLGYVLERDNARFQSLISTFLHSFQAHIDAVLTTFASPALSAPPPFDPRAPPSLLSFLARLKQLLFNLVLVHRFVPSSERPFYMDLIDRLVGRLIWKLLGMAKETGGGKDIASDILARCSRANLLREDVRSRLAAMAGQ